MEASREENIRTYQGLMCHLKYSPYFLYNFAYELSAANDYGYSQKIAAICQEYWADYDLELLMAINASRLEILNLLYCISILRQRCVQIGLCQFIIHIKYTKDE